MGKVLRPRRRQWRLEMRMERSRELPSNPRRRQRRLEMRIKRSRELLSNPSTPLPARTRRAASTTLKT